MRRTAFSGQILIPLCLILALVTGCGRRAPEKDAEGNVWLDSWTQVGNFLAAETVPEGFSLLDNKDVLAPQGLYFATWTAGEPGSYTNEEGEEVRFYDAQLYLLVAEKDVAGEAGPELEKWIDTARSHYEIEKEETLAAGPLSYTVLHYKCNPDSSPYERGVSAFAQCGENAICAELTRLPDKPYDLPALLKTFLGGLHYAAL